MPRQENSRSLDDLLASARAGLTRLDPGAAYAAVRDGGAKLVDTRPEFQRRADGDIPGAIVIERNHLEWRLHPESTGRIPEAADFAIPWIVICNEGYASSLAAATLQQIGLRATDVVGGFQAWRAAGLPVSSPGEVAPPRLARESAAPRELRTSRLVLRRWVAADLVPFAAMNADPRVMEHYPSTLSREESDALAARIDAHFARHGFGLWAVEVPGVTPFIGYVGLSVPGFQAHFTPAVEIGWRLAVEHWGHGYATEAAEAAATFAFHTLGLREIVSFTVPANVRSRRVMERIGMAHDPADDFDHPGIAEGDPMRRHVLYRMSPRRRT